MNTILKAEHVSKIYGKKGANSYPAIHDLSFSMNEGEFVGIMGPSGSGKTTLLNMIATLDPATGGEITIGGTSIKHMDEDALSDFRSQHLGFIFQDFNLLENMSARENIALPLALQNIAAPKIDATVNQVAGLLGIEPLLGKYPGELSGGQKQRTAIARALVHSPKLLLADEPTGALDSKNAALLMETFNDLNKRQNTSILLVTHDPRSASYCSRLLFIKDGRIDREVNASGSREQFHQEILTILAGMERPGVDGDFR